MGTLCKHKKSKLVVKEVAELHLDNYKLFL